MASSSREFSKQGVSTESSLEPRVLLEFVDEGSIAAITLNDPKLGNPMSPEMGDAFRESIGRLKEPALESDAARQAESYATEEFRRRIAKYLPNWYEK